MLYTDLVLLRSFSCIFKRDAKNWYDDELCATMAADVPSRLRRNDAMRLNMTGR